MVLPASHGIPRVPRYSGTTSRETGAFRLRGYHPLWRPFPGSLSYTPIFLLSGTSPDVAPQPRPYFYRRFGLFPFSLTATKGISIDFSSWGYLDVSLPPVRPPGLCIHPGVTDHYAGWVSPFGNLRIKACLAAPRSFSQLATSFIAFSRLGIHRVPFIA